MRNFRLSSGKISAAPHAGAEAPVSPFGGVVVMWVPPDSVYFRIDCTAYRFRNPKSRPPIFTFPGVAHILYASPRSPSLLLGPPMHSWGARRVPPATDSPVRPLGSGAFPIGESPRPLRGAGGPHQMAARRIRNRHPPTGRPVIPPISAKRRPYAWNVRGFRSR